MISSIFGKTKPINYIIVLTFLFLLYVLVQFYPFLKPFNSLQIVIQISAFGTLVSSVFLVNFIIKTNKLSGSNSFAILFFGLLFMVFPNTLLDFKGIFCSLFLLLAIRRTLSIRSLKGIKLKVFDATLWVLISSFFYSWSLLFLLLIFTAIYIYEPKNIRNWLVPLASTFVFGMITYSILLVLKSEYFLLDQYAFSVDFTKDFFLNKVFSNRFLLYIISVTTLGVWTFIKSGNSGVGKILSMRLMGFSYLLGLIVYFLSSIEGNCIVITFFPSVIFFTNYIEAIQKEKIKELVLILSIFIPFLVFISNLILL